MKSEERRVKRSGLGIIIESLRHGKAVPPPFNKGGYYRVVEDADLYETVAVMQS